jgi:mersacidin/lichenicidin family type 2 lantibiotic
MRFTNSSPKQAAKRICFIGIPLTLETTMSKTVDVIRAWKDEDYRSSLSDAQRAELPDNPAGLIELSETDLRNAAGGSIIPLTFPSFCIYCPSVNPLGCSMITICPIDIQE